MDTIFVTDDDALTAKVAHSWSGKTKEESLVSRQDQKHDMSAQMPGVRVQPGDDTHFAMLQTLLMMPDEKNEEQSVLALCPNSLDYCWKNIDSTCKSLPIET